MMKKRKNLERAIILGLLLSTSVYGNVWAEEGYIDGPANNVKWTNSYADANGNITSIVEDSDGGSGNIFVSGDVNISGKLTLINTKENQTGGKGINAYNGHVTISAKTIEITTYDDGIFTTGATSDGAKDPKPDVSVNSFDNLKIVSTNGFGIVNNGNGYKEGPSKPVQTYGDIILEGNANSVITIQGGYNVKANFPWLNGKAAIKNSYKDSKTVIDSNGGTVCLQGVAYGTWASAGKVEIYGANNTIKGILDERFEKNYDANSYKNYGIGVYNSSTNASTEIFANENNIIHGDKESVKVTAGIVTISGKNNYFDISYDEKIVADSLKEQVKNVERYALHTTSKNAIIDVVAGENNSIDSIQEGIYAQNGTVNLTAGANNFIYAGKIVENVYGNQKAVNAESGGKVTLTAKKGNALSGAVYATGANTMVDLNSITESMPVNTIYSAAKIDNAGDLDNKDNGGIDIVSSLYAEEDAQISLSGINNIQTYYGDPTDERTSERAVWAYKGANIDIDGLTTISTYMYEKSPNSKDLAVAAGTATNLDFDTVNKGVADEDMAVVNINYDSITTNVNGESKTVASSIEGDILAAYGGTVNITPKSADTVGINITGNLLSGNNGVLNVNLGNGGVLTGRADDYGDAGIVTESGHTKIFDPAFSSEIYKGGQVNLDMGEGSRWNVTGQSWITSIDTTNTSGDVRNNAVIDLISANTDRKENAHALTVYDFNGDATFNMSLDADRNVSDMLYIKNANGDYIVNVVDAVTTADMYANGFDGLRFATVGVDSNATFRAITADQGMLNVEYEVGTDSYENNAENSAYNGSEMSTDKPGDTMVDGFFGSEGEPGKPIQAAATNSIMTMDLAAETANEEDAALDNANDSGLEEVTNFKLIARKGEELSDGGKTVLNMSRANYSNAIYMDRLNKRLGEARYINGEEDQGMWVRIRHDRIGKTDAYRSQNTMYELGYDEKQECDNGMRRVGFAIDYMHGDTGYNDIAGKGEIDRYGLWLYDTWMGDKGHYADYVAKWGHLKNDFGIYAPTTGEEITGDYSNNVFSISAEYGRKKDIGSDWYFEPQAQLQLARVTGADYVTSQGTKVSVDGINSLIGRAGFRLGKDFGEEKQSTVYIKADVLHEFLGDQDIRALDATTNGNWSTISYENEGTWYDVGIGFAAMMSKNSYAFLDLEKSFGHDNDETYQINAGLQWTF